LEEIIDWESEKGQNIKKVRESNEKWKNLPLEDNKYILSVYYHDIKGRKGESGVVERGSFFRYHPKTKKPFFVKVPDWIYKNIRANCDSFEVIIKD
jgi:hypothetical protein